MGKNRKSKSKVEPFSVFLGEYFSRRRREFGQLTDAIDPARTVWKDMSDEERAKYKMIAKTRQAKKREDMTNKLDSYGRPVLVVQELRDAEQRREAESREKTYAMVSEALSTGMFLDREYTIGHVHLFCADIGDPSEVDHFPAEIGLSTFCLGTGMKTGGFMYELIDSRPFPPGMVSKARESAQHHGIDVYEHGDKLKKNFGTMKSDVRRVLERLAGDGSLVLDPIFVRKEHYHRMKQSLTYIFQKGSTNSSDSLDLPKIFHLEDLLLAFRGKVEEYCSKIGREIKKIYNYESYVDGVLDSTSFDFESGTACPFHEDMGDPSKCALAYSRQRAMLMMKDVCPLIGHQLVPGKHLPKDLKVAKQEL